MAVTSRFAPRAASLPAWRKKRADQADEAVGRKAQHDQQQQPDEQQPILRQRRQQLGQQHHDERADRAGPSTRSAPPIITTSRNRIDWKNGKDSGLMKLLIEANMPPASPASRRRDARTPRCGSASDRGRSTGSRLRNRAPPAWPLPHGLALEPGIQPERRSAVSSSDQNGDARARRTRAPSRLGAGMPIRPFQPPVSRSTRPRPARRRSRRRSSPSRDRARARAAPEWRAARPRRPRRAPASGSASQKPMAVLVGQDADRIGADGVERHVAERDLAGQPEQHVEADADDRREPDQRDDEELVAVGAPDEGAERGQRARGSERARGQLIPCAPRRGRTGRSAAPPARR